MSFSSASLGSGCCSCSSDKNVSAADATNHWHHELAGRFHMYPGSIEQFLDELVPCSAPFTREDDLSTAFADYNPVEGGEKMSYPGMLAGLNTIVDLLGERRLHFYQTHGRQMQFPFKEFVHRHEGTFPDISVSFPDAPLVELSNLIWGDLSFVMELKPTAEEDPFGRDGVKHARTIIQMARNARNLLLANGSLAAFVVGIYGQTVRLVRFDHSGAIVAPPFCLKADPLPSQRDGLPPRPALTPRPQLLQRFLWHFTHPIRGATVVGCDPSTRRLTSDDYDWVAKQLTEAKVQNVEEQLTEFYKGRRVEVPSLTPGAPSHHYIMYCPLDINGRLLSRATNVWRAIEDTRSLDADGNLIDDLSRPRKPQILKEAWRQLLRNSEASFYERLSATISEEERVGLPKLVCGGDLGIEEVREWARTSPNVSFMDGQRQLRLSSSEPEVATAESSQTSLEEPEPFPFPFPQHQTFTWAIGFDKSTTYRERSHMRFVIDDVGRPLTKFRSTRDVVVAMRDAIKGHKLAFEQGGVLHRDVSLGNVLIVDEESERHSGFLHDFDYSSMVDVAPGDDFPLPQDPEDAIGDAFESTSAKMKDDQRKERTGTYYYIAIELLMMRVIHDVHHDLESFYWVLVYVILSHTAHTVPISKARELFSFGSDERTAGLKTMWVNMGCLALDLPSNKPLVQLVTEFNSMIVPPTRTRRQVEHTRDYMTYDAVLRAFDNALAMEGWPESDFVPLRWFEEKGEDLPGIVCDPATEEVMRAPGEPSPPPSPTGYPTRSKTKRGSDAPDANPEVMPNEAGPSTQRRSKRQRTGEAPPASSFAERGNRAGSRRRGSKGSKSLSQKAGSSKSGAR